MNLLKILEDELSRLKSENVYKYETEIETPQNARVKVNGKEVIMIASNNYLGLANHPKIKKVAIDGIKKYGYGVASVRFICGTQDIHRVLEKKIAKFIGVEDVILFSSCFAANEGFFASIINEKLGSENHKDVLYSDKLNHASIIDGQRLCRNEFVDKKIYNHSDMNELEKLLEDDKNKNYRFRFIVTDGVFSMEGYLANLSRIVELGKKYNALVFVDDSHAIGVCGKSGRGTPEELNQFKKIGVITGTLGKAIGGASGGYIGASKKIVEYLRQKSRPYIFSNSLPAPIVFGAIAAFDLLENDLSLVSKLHQNTKSFREKISQLGFKILEGSHPITPIMLGDASVAQNMSKLLLKNGIYVKGLWFPVVPKGEARLRVQVSASLSKKDLDDALNIFEFVGKKMKII